MYTLLKFEASWCGPCRMMKEQLEQTPLHHSNVNLVNVDVDECDDMAETYNITNVPALVLKAEDGSVISRKVGFMTPAQIDEWLNDYCHA